MSEHNFSGFSPDTLQFLENLSRNNEKRWFENHRQEYERYVLSPFKELVKALGNFMLSIDSEFEISPSVNKTISRIYRDIRFSNDKSPFRANMWLVFKRPRKDWQSAPAYFFEIFPDYYRYGMGFYSATPATMSRFRDMVDDDPDEFLNAISPFADQTIFELKGEKYKKKIESKHPVNIQYWYQHKNFYLVCNREIDDLLFSPDLADELIKSFELLAPFYQYIWKIKLFKTI